MRTQGKGFTLIEVAIALAVLAMMVVALFASLRFGTATYERVTAANDRTWSLFASQRLVRTLIESTYPLQTEVGAERKGMAGIEGDAQSLVLIAHAPHALTGHGGLLRVELSMRAAGGSKSLFMRVAPLLEGVSQQVVGVEEELLEDVAEIEFAYAAMGGGTTDWTNEWSSAALPAAIRMRVKTTRARDWSELVASPRGTIDANCPFDVVAQRCRGAS